MDWKGIERTIAGKLGGERVPVSGRISGEEPDIKHDRFAIEVKARQKARPGGSAIIPKWMDYALQQAEKSRQPHHEAAIVILHEQGKRHDDDFVLMSFKDFLELTALPER